MSFASYPISMDLQGKRGFAPLESPIRYLKTVGRVLPKPEHPSCLDFPLPWSRGSLVLLWQAHSKTIMLLQNPRLDVAFKIWSHSCFLGGNNHLSLLSRLAYSYGCGWHLLLQGLTADTAKLIQQSCFSIRSSPTCRIRLC